MRERYILYLTIGTFAFFCIAGFFFLPELKAGTSIAMKRVKETGPDLLGLIPPVQDGDARVSRLSLGSEGGSEGNIPPSDILRVNRMNDMQRLASRIREDQVAINRSQTNAVLPRPDSGFDAPLHTLVSDGALSGGAPVLSGGALPSYLGKPPEDPVTLERRNHVKAMMKHAWDNYVQYAWGESRGVWGIRGWLVS